MVFGRSNMTENFPFADEPAERGHGGKAKYVLKMGSPGILDVDMKKRNGQTDSTPITSHRISDLETLGTFLMFATGRLRF